MSTRIEVVDWGTFKQSVLNDLHDQKKVLIKYLLSKVRARDFHAVSDAANDIREIEAKQNLLMRIEAKVVSE